MKYNIIMKTGSRSAAELSGWERIQGKHDFQDNIFRKKARMSPVSRTCAPRGGRVQKKIKLAVMCSRMSRAEVNLSSY